MVAAGPGVLNLPYSAQAKKQADEVDRVVITSGRINSEILHKVSKMGISVLISISAPTNLGVKITDSLGITL